MKKTNVVIASVLKPVDDTRMYEKIALTLAKQEKYHIHIIGFQSSNLDSISHPNISFYPIFSFSRLSVKRFFASWNYYKIVLKIKPELIIVTCTDLLIVTVCNKILFGTKILYDVQENNLTNSLYTEKFRPPLNFILGYLLRMIECVCSPFITHFILAEKIYQHELPFIGKHFTVIENKYQPLAHQAFIQSIPGKKRSIYHLLYSGTISESYGIFEAIELVKRLYQIDNRFHLTIIGFCADPRVFANVVGLTCSCPFINIIGGNVLVPHIEIIKAIQMADIGLISYRYNKSTARRIPTKLYEYMYYNLPMLIPGNPLWKQVCEPYMAALMIDYSNYDPLHIINELSIMSFYRTNHRKDTLLWIDEGISLIKLFSII